MLLRSVETDFAANVYVFPGGAVDEADRHRELGAICSGLSDAEASSKLGVDAGGLAFWVAAIRECFEEAGVLLAYDDADEFVALTNTAHAERYAQHRQGLNDRVAHFSDICAAEQLTLPVDRVHYYAHWITPQGVPKRFDTRFFVCQAPSDQAPMHDGRETVDSCWISPREALAAADRGEFRIVPVTRKQLESMMPYDSSASFIAAAAARTRIPTVLPVLQWGADGKPQSVRIPLP